MAKKKKAARRKKTGLGRISISRFNVKKFSLKELKLARKNGLKSKKPAKPKSQSIQALQNYVNRFNDWVETIKENAKSRQKVLALQGLAKQCRVPRKRSTSRRKK